MSHGYAQAITKTDSIVVPAADTLQPAASASFLDDKVNYKAEDSTTADMVNKKAYLYNKAEVYYQDMILKAGYIEIDFARKMVIAKGITDSSGAIVQRPVFEQGEDKFTAGEIIYNFETRKGKIKNVLTQQGDGYIHGSDIKKDTNNMYYVSEGKYTTCDLEAPHYYLSAKKIKVIPQDKIVTGPAELYIADVPTPLILPFGYFPNKKGRRSGLLMPAYGESNIYGFQLTNGGFYFGGSEYFDLILLADVYSNGGFASKNKSNYNKRYKFNGSVTFDYSHILLGNPELLNQPITDNYSVTWYHAQDPASNPSSRFSSNINYVTDKYNKYSGNITSQYTRNTYLSQLSYSKTFTGSPFSLNATGFLSQNTITKASTLRLPSLNATMSRITPFKNNSVIGNKWYDQIGISATLEASNSVSTYDSLLFKPDIINKMQNGASFRIPISTSFTLLKYITVTPSINSTNNVYFQTINRTYNMETKKVVEDTIPITQMSNELSANTSFSTRLYGDYFFKTKNLKQIHHIASPSLNFNYHPDYSKPNYGYYKSYDTNLVNPDEHRVLYSVFERGVYSGPPPGESGSIGFSLSNSLEAKTKHNSDSGAVFKKLTLLDNLNGSVSYNIAAEHYKWSMINIGARSVLFNLIDINADASFDPYQQRTYNKSKQRVEKFEWENGRLARFKNANLTMGTSLRSKEKKTGDSKTITAQPPPVVSSDELEYIQTHPDQYIDFNIPWSLNISYGVYYTPDNEKSNQLTQNITFGGDLSITKKWKINATSGFDFTAKKITLTNINIYRDLHCWELHFNWVPFGFRQSFSLEINVKSSMLRDLKLRKRNLDSRALN